MNRARVAVVKFGGSLLTASDLPRRLRAWLAAERAAHAESHFIVVVGGGKFVDAVRELNEKTPLDEAAAHWICVDLMATTAQIVAAMLPELTVVDSFPLLRDRLTVPGVTLFSPGQFLREVEPFQPDERLPADWSVTSDAIAGRLAVVLGADELVIIKSPPPPIGDPSAAGLAALAKEGFIDESLVRLADELPPLRFSELATIL